MTQLASRSPAEVSMALPSGKGPALPTCLIARPPPALRIAFETPWGSSNHGGIRFREHTGIHWEGQEAKVSASVIVNGQKKATWTSHTWQRSCHGRCLACLAAVRPLWRARRARRGCLRPSWLHHYYHRWPRHAFLRARLDPQARAQVTG